MEKHKHLSYLVVYTSKMFRIGFVEVKNIKKICARCSLLPVQEGYSWLHMEVILVMIKEGMDS